MTSPLRIIVTGLIAQHPWLGGVSWDYVQYVLGLAHLHHDVYYFEDSGQWPYKLDGGSSGEDWVARDCSYHVQYLANVMARCGLGNKWAYHFPVASEWFGLSRPEREAVVQSADLLINISGTLWHPEDYRQVSRLAYIDSDPVFTQVKLKLSEGQIKFRQRLEAHDIHFSFGECLVEQVPGTGRRWRATRQPIILSEWRPEMPRREVFTTVMSWTSYEPLTYLGETYGQKDVEFKRFLELPARVTPIQLEVAVGKIHHVDWETNEASLPPGVLDTARSHPQWTPRDLLTHFGWHIVDPLDVGSDLDRYRRYIETSKAEWSVAKNGYVRGQPGWFSCRSACYLAAGRPVVVQDTGFGQVLPVGEGILPFTTVEEAAAAIHNIEANYERHAKAARAVAEEYFDSDKVLTRLVDEAISCELDKPLEEKYP